MIKSVLVENNILNKIRSNLAKKKLHLAYKTRRFRNYMKSPNVQERWKEAKSRTLEAIGSM